MLAHFHDRFWWAPDEGNYAHVAERVLDGEVLHADVQDIHPGYINFTNAAALALFGRELVSMRYPLVLLGVAQCLIMLLILRPAGPFTAAVGATATTALGFIQFLNPTAHWYCLFLVIALAGVLHLAPRDARWRLPAAGAIVMTAVLFRQLSGVLIAMGAVTWLLLDTPSSGTSESGRPWLARAIILVMMVGLSAYLARGSDALGWLLFGIWPMLLLAHAARTVRVSNGALLALLAPFSLGAMAAVLPLLVYHLAHGSLGAWYGDVIVTALSFPGLPFFGTASHANLLRETVGALSSGSLRVLMNGAFWIMMTTVAALTGALLLRRLHRSGSAAHREAPPALPVLAVFYGVVSLHYQIPIYLMYTVGLSVAALLLLGRSRVALPAVMASMLAIAVHYHAGQPLSRGMAGTASGVRVETSENAIVPRAGLRVEDADARTYLALLEMIERETSPDASILALPSHAELYFLSGRRNPVRFFNSALGIVTDDQLERVLSLIEREPPALVFHDPRDKYNTPATHAVVKRVAETYEALPAVGGIMVYRRAGALVQLPSDQRLRP